MRDKWLLLPLALLLLLPLSASRSEAKGDINFMLGLKYVDEFADFQKVRTNEDDLGYQPDFGIEMTFRGADWPVGVAVDILGSAREEDLDYSFFSSSVDMEVSVSTAELDAGIRKIWELPGRTVRPYLGGGLALAYGEIEFEGEVFPPLFGLSSLSDSDDGAGVGYWVGGGVYWRLNERFNIGANARYSSAKVEFAFDELDDVGGIHIGMLLGWGW